LALADQNRSASDQACSILQVVEPEASCHVFDKMDIYRLIQRVSENIDQLADHFGQINRLAKGYDGEQRIDKNECRTQEPVYGCSSLIFRLPLSVLDNITLAGSWRVLLLDHPGDCGGALPTLISLRSLSISLLTCSHD
jgi:hypothetical protein